VSPINNLSSLRERAHSGANTLQIRRVPKKHACAHLITGDDT
jgi:hypothetical protein